MENSTLTTSNKMTTSNSMGKERKDGERTTGSNANESGPPCEVSSNGVIGQGAHPLPAFQMTTVEEQKVLKARIARSKRHMARQTSRNLKQTSSLSTPLSSPPSNSTRPKRTIRAHSSSESNNNSEVPHTIYTPDNVKLRFVLQKVLTCSDVSDQGRIVLPKREAEDYLPQLFSREGTLFIMKEVLSNTEWQLTYRFWANQKGRIYVLYNCGEFVNKNMLEVGDKLSLYQDVFKNVYFSITKKEKQMSMITRTTIDEELDEAYEPTT